MIIAIIILSIITFGLILLLLSCIIHIRKIQKELEAISYVQNANNQDIIKLTNHAHQVAYAINDITSYIVDDASKSNKIPYYGPIGKA
jgi:ABC-type transport system involved in multi-copper enzyme maturation permease subunit